MDAWTFDEPPSPDVRCQAARREVYGRVYELITGDPRDGEHPYVGMTRQTIHQRVHAGRNAHTSAQSVARDPWKARILPGRAGYRLLETVYATDDDAADARELRRVESFWIDRLRTTHNDVRPVRPPVHERGPVRVRRRTAVQRRASRRTRGRVVSLLLLVAAFTFLAVRAILLMQLPWPLAPLAGLSVGTALGWAAFDWLDRRYRRLVRRRR